jgi:hypothetical protein
MKLHHRIDENPCHCRSLKRVTEGNEMGKFCEPINHHQDRVEFIRERKAIDEIHGDVVPRSSRWWQRLK